MKTPSDIRAMLGVIRSAGALVANEDATVTGDVLLALESFGCWVLDEDLDGEQVSSPLSFALARTGTVTDARTDPR